MGYKTIAVHLADERCAATLLPYAVAFADKFDAHLTALTALPPKFVAPSMDAMGAGAVIEAQRDAFEAQAARLKAAFEAATANATFTSDWRLLDPGFERAADVVVAAARAADLVVAAKAAPSEQDEMLDATDELIVESGRPIVCLPCAGSAGADPRRILLAWNGRREAARAAFDALPLLKAAESVGVLWINPQDEYEDPGEIATADMCQALARHGVKCEAVTAISTSESVGAVLLRQAKERSADLLVMGAYGHSRFREFLFGGATRHVLRHLGLPVLMSR
jgi:nucleotide-binding universal stress UspA family protein